MPSTVSASRRPDGGRCWRALTRGDLLTLLVAAMLCSASYYLAIWHNSRGAADSDVLGPSTGASGASSACQSSARAGAAGADEPLDFEAHHTAESAELSVSASPAATTTMTRARRALRGDQGTRDAERRLSPAPAGEPALRVLPASVRAVSTSEPW